MNWPLFLQQHHIEYVESGPNTARGWISINCVYCKDPSHHLGISLESNGFNCWRCNNHGGAIKLIQKLIHVDYEEAQRIAGVKTIITVSDATFTSYVKGMMTMETSIQEPRTIDFPQEIKPLCLAERQDYFPSNILMYFGQRRGYKARETMDLSQLYRLRYALTGPYRYRIVFPVYDENQTLLTWTGRSLSNIAIRYKDLSESLEKAREEALPQALASIKDCLWNYHELANTHYNKLIVCEGPFDAIRIDYYGRSLGVRSTCLFGKRISKAQINLVERIRNHCDNLYITLDNNFATDMTKIAGQLAHLNCKIKRLPEGINEPEKLSKQQVEEWI